jgi:hypothetical protein
MSRYLDTPLTANGIYAARCAILHAYSAESEASGAGRAKAIMYKWRHGHKPDDERLAELARTATVIEVQSLYEALESAVIEFKATSRVIRLLKTTWHNMSLSCFATSPGRRSTSGSPLRTSFFG